MFGHRRQARGDSEQARDRRGLHGLARRERASQSTTSSRLRRFRTRKTKLEAFKLYGTYNLKDNLSIAGSYQYEHYDTNDWRLDGIGPATVSNLLALGAQSPNYSVSVFRVALRYRF